ncbi:preprotein translocase subunit SecF [Thermotomaculum hydrothermale]|uniref:Protein-export membrane protein SecF n=1 Tax=Thermotomaculum hydrothermale TaxID=981385 RepID=A0A7R6SY63_9BACT|nr:protein translocase subunit SecF [Thermotomaculum hydrothermale]BBB32444.1 preprotein translocase subunit SecF [Thermotomaculum hydrothermale]
MFKKDIDFMGVRYIAITISMIFIIGSIIAVLTLGIRKGVQFVGGTEIQVKFKNSITIDELRKLFVESNFKHVQIVQVKTDSNLSEYIIKIKGKEGDETSVGSSVAKKISNVLVKAANEKVEEGKYDINKVNKTDLADILRKANVLKLDKLSMVGVEKDKDQYSKLAQEIIDERSNHNDFFNSVDDAVKNIKNEDVKKFIKDNFYAGNYIILKVDTFSPSISVEQTEKAVTAIVMALIAILIYVSIRFKFDYAIGAILALVHDVIITLGFFSIFKQEFTLPVVAAFLTIVGYSLNDTIVVFDRIRENIKLMKNKKLFDIINISINQTLSRTLLTSLTTLFVVVVLFIFGGVALKGFSFPLLVGIVVGTYSSIFIASPIFYFIETKVYKVK